MSATTYEWRQTSGAPAVVLSGADTLRPSFTAPAGATTLEFELVVRTASGVQSFPSAVAVDVVERRPTHGRNVGPLASAVRASSQSPEGGASARAAVDGVVDGFIRAEPNPYGNTTCEWVAASNDKVGAWIELAWDKPLARVARVGLFERPLWDSHIVAGKLELSDGSLVDVPELSRVAQETVVDFGTPKRNIRWARFTVTRVMESTRPIGLAEFAVYEFDDTNQCGQAPQPPQAQLPAVVQPQEAGDNEQNQDPLDNDKQNNGATNENTQQQQQQQQKGPAFKPEPLHDLEEEPNSGKGKLLVVAVAASVVALVALVLRKHKARIDLLPVRMPSSQSHFE